MIKASELRIGNLFHDRGGKVLRLDYMEWLGPDYFKLNQRTIIDGVDFHPLNEFSDYAKGIELTPDWLDRFGFEIVEENKFKNHAGKYWAHEAVLLFFNDSPPENTYLIGVGDYLSNFDGTGEYVAITKRWITAVHELQNFYFQWTGRELELKK